MVPYTPVQIETIRRELSRRLDTNTVQIGPLVNGDIKYAYIPKITPEGPSTTKPTYLAGSMKKREVMDIFAEEERIGAIMDKNPRLAIMEVGFESYGINPAEVTRIGNKFLIKNKDGTRIKIRAESLVEDIKTYHEPQKKQEIIMRMNVLSRRSGILEIDFEPLYSPDVTLNQIRLAEKLFERAVKSYSSGITLNPDEVVYVRGKFHINEGGKVDLIMDEPVSITYEKTPIRLADKEKIVMRNLDGWRSLTRLTKFLSEE